MIQGRLRRPNQTEPGGSHPSSSASQLEAPGVVEFQPILAVSHYKKRALVARRVFQGVVDTS